MHNPSICLPVSVSARVRACSPDSPCNHPPHTVTRWLSVGACQGLCGLRKAAQPFPFPGACSAPAWPRRPVFMSCVIADLSLSRRPASVRISSRSLRARSKSHHRLPQSHRVSHNPSSCSGLVPPSPPPSSHLYTLAPLPPPWLAGRRWRG